MHLCARIRRTYLSATRDMYDIIIMCVCVRGGTNRVVKVHFSVVELGLEHERPGVGLLRQTLDDHVQRRGARHPVYGVHDVHGHYGAEHVVRVGHGGRGDGLVADHRHRVPRLFDQPADDARQPFRVGG